MIWSISWRNVWRNKTRSIVVISAIALGIFAGVFSTAFMKGMTDQRIESAIETEISHIQIHQPGFRESSEIDLLIDNSDSLINNLQKNPAIANVSRRIIINAMAASAETSSGIKLIGVYPKAESKVTTIHNKIIEGEYFKGVKRNPVVVGKKLAEKLNLRLHSKIILTFQDFEGNITGAACRIAGIYNTNNSLLDELNVYIKFTDLQKLTEIPKNTNHEIAINLYNNLTANDVSKNLSKEYPSLEILPWQTLKPELGYMSALMDVYMYIFIVIILFALGFGIVNTMLMVVLERVKEIGMLMAVGMNRLRVFNMIVLETIFLTLTGGIVGIIFGTIIAKYFSLHPINLTWYSQGLSAIGWDSRVYTSVNFQMILIVTVLVILTGIVAAIYPAIKALRNDPAEALRTE
ncbi:MAG: ABC transporter permease [Chlorobi bacterium]|nr:ABC transporter permease [Chlorobiota bacterium]